MRKLTIREKFLIGLLLIILMISGYIMLFYIPTTQKIDLLTTQIKQTKELITQSQEKLDEQTKMEKTLKLLFENNPNPLSIPSYDNSQAVMFELNSILKNSNSYSLSFDTVDTQPDIVQRNISMQFTCDTYDNAKAILEQLHNSQYRCMLQDVMLTEQENNVNANVTMVFFEHQFDN